MSSAICFNLDQSKILSSGNGLMDMYLFPDSRLTPIIHLDASVYQINISVSHSNISTENLTLSYNVTATSANTSTTICHEDSNPTVCDALDPGTVYNISVAVLMMDRIIAQNSTSEATGKSILITQKIQYS